MNDLITRSDDERLGNFRVQVPAQDVGLIVASLRASLQREEAERAERDEIKAKYDELINGMARLAKERISILAEKNELRRQYLLEGK